MSDVSEAVTVTSEPVSPIELTLFTKYTDLLTVCSYTICVFRWKCKVNWSTGERLL